jgi:hypothetical protein
MYIIYNINTLELYAMVYMCDCQYNYILYCINKYNFYLYDHKEDYTIATSSSSVYLNFSLIR